MSSLQLVVHDAPTDEPDGHEGTRVPSSGRMIIRDTETGDVVEITPEMRARAAAARRLIEQATLAKSIALATVAEERLYLADGYGSFKDWVLLELGTSYSSAKEYVKIGRRIGPLLPGLTSGDGLASEAPQLAEGHPSGLDSERSEAISGLGYKKLVALTRLDEAKFADVVERGVVTLGNEDFTLDDLQDMSNREVAARVRDEITPLKAQLAEQAAAIETLEAEKAALLADADASAKTVADARALEAELGPRASLLADKRQRVTDLRDIVDRFLPALLATGVEPSDPETLQHDLMSLLDKLDLCTERARDTYATVQAALAGLHHSSHA